MRRMQWKRCELPKNFMHSTKKGCINEKKGLTVNFNGWSFYLHKFFESVSTNIDNHIVIKKEKFC